LNSSLHYLVWNNSAIYAVSIPAETVAVSIMRKAVDDYMSVPLGTRLTVRLASPPRSVYICPVFKFLLFGIDLFYQILSDKFNFHSYRSNIKSTLNSPYYIDPTTYILFAIGTNGGLL
jgi:hypothetical protein